MTKEIMKKKREVGIVRSSYSTPWFLSLASSQIRQSDCDNVRRDKRVFEIVEPGVMWDSLPEGAEYVVGVGKHERIQKKNTLKQSALHGIKYNAMDGKFVNPVVKIPYTDKIAKMVDTAEKRTDKQNFNTFISQYFTNIRRHYTGRGGQKTFVSMADYQPDTAQVKNWNEVEQTMRQQFKQDLAVLEIMIGHTIHIKPEYGDVSVYELFWGTRHLEHKYIELKPMDEVMPPSVFLKTGLFQNWAKSVIENARFGRLLKTYVETINPDDDVLVVEKSYYGRSDDYKNVTPKSDDIVLFDVTDWYLIIVAVSENIKGAVELIGDDTDKLIKLLCNIPKEDSNESEV